jgi:hypothetical protein
MTLREMSRKRGLATLGADGLADQISFGGSSRQPVEVVPALIDHNQPTLAVSADMAVLAFDVPSAGAIPAQSAGSGVF